MRRARVALVNFLLALVSTAHTLSAQATDTTGLGFLRVLDSIRTVNPEYYETIRTIFITNVQTTLGELGFGPTLLSGVADSGTSAALRLYEQARKLSITGDPFTRATFTQLDSDADRLKETERRPSLGYKRFDWLGDWLIAEGPWLMEGEPQTYMRVHVYCDRSRSQCDLAWARLGVGPGFFESWALQILTESFAVDRWDQAEIISAPRDYSCTRYVLRINRLQESVVMTRSTLSQTGFVCETLEVRDVVTHLVKPEDWPASTDVLDLYNLSATARAAATDPFGGAFPRR